MYTDLSTASEIRPTSLVPAPVTRTPKKNTQTRRYVFSHTRQWRFQATGTRRSLGMPRADTPGGGHWKEKGGAFQSSLILIKITALPCIKRSGVARYVVRAVRPSPCHRSKTVLKDRAAGAVVPATPCVCNHGRLPRTCLHMKTLDQVDQTGTLACVTSMVLYICRDRERTA